MKQENQASKFDGTLDLRRHPIDPEHYATVAKATAEALADEIAVRVTIPENCVHEVHLTAYTVLLEWFTGKFKPAPTDPPDGAPDQTEKPTPTPTYDTTHERDIDLGPKLDRLLKE